MNQTTAAIREGLTELSEIHYLPLQHFNGALSDMWDDSNIVASPLEADEMLFCLGEDEQSNEQNESVKSEPTQLSIPADRPPPWFIGMSRAFKKAISGIDRKLMGRVLEALTEITEDPIRPRGDTVKALQGELRGCWRYRIGDFRLIYMPDSKSGNVTLLEFASRGSIYGD